MVRKAWQKHSPMPENFSLNLGSSRIKKITSYGGGEFLITRNRFADPTVRNRKASVLPATTEAKGIWPYNNIQVITSLCFSFLRQDRVIYFFFTTKKYQ